jgi:hypothetical protein
MAGIALALAACLFAYAGCGTSGRPPLLGSDDGTTSAGGSGDAGSPTFELDSGPPVCPRGPDGGLCGCLDLPLLGDAPNIYFVLDRSGSMEENGKWTTMRAVITDVMRKLGPRGRFGAAVFPDPRQDECAPGIEVMALRPGDSPAGSYGPATSAFGLSTSFIARGGTPTAATLVALKNKLAALAGKTYVILATDGGPNCDPLAQCDIAHCIPNIEGAAGCEPNTPPSCCDQSPENCLDGNAAVAAVASLKSAGIPTYVVGVPGSGPYAAVLGSMAAAGGTTRYYDVNSADQSAFAAALSTIAAKITATCTFSLDQAPPDSGMVNVYLDDAVVPRDPVDGWSIDGAKVTLLGAACQKVLNGNALTVRIVAGCPTVLK